MKSKRKIINMSKAEIAFLESRGKVQLSEDEVGETLKKAKEVVLWGPEAKILELSLRKAWKDANGEKVSQNVSELLRNGNFYDAPKVDNVLSDVKLLGNVIHDTIHTKALSLMHLTQEQAVKSHKQLKKFDAPSDLGERGSATLFAMLLSLQSYIDKFFSDTLPKKIADTVAKAKKAIADEAIDTAIQVLEDMPKNYFNVLSDTVIGRLWTITVVQVIYMEGAQQYVFQTQGDTGVCIVCQGAEGLQFPVMDAINKIDKYLDLAGDVDAQNKIFPFYHEKDVKNFGAEVLIPPIHGFCRCWLAIV